MSKKMVVMSAMRELRPPRFINFAVWFRCGELPEGEAERFYRGASSRSAAPK